MNTVLAILGLIAGAAIVVISICYQDIDKKKYLAVSLLKSINTELREWMDGGSELFSGRFADGENAGIYAKLLSDFDAIPKYRAHQKVALLNQAYDMVCRATYDHYGDPDVKEIADRVSGQGKELSVLIDQYNTYANKYNASVENKLFGIIGKLFRMKELDALSSLQVW